MSELRATQLQDLPWELIQHILSLLPDAKSLHSASVSCRLFQSLFKNHEHSICSAVADNAIGSDCLHDVFATYSSSTIAPKYWTPSRAWQFFDQYLSPQGRPFAPTCLNLAMLENMDRLHACVVYFIDDFSRSAILQKNQEDNEGTSHVLTISERQRFVHAFYRFEIYCNIFGDHIRAPVPTDMLGDQFFDRFAPWEMEQLACVHDYLMFEITAG